MSDTQVVSQPVRSDTRWVLNMEVYKRKTLAKGAITSSERREVAGLSRSTEYRWMRGVTVPDWEKAREVADRLDVHVHELIVEVSCMAAIDLDQRITLTRAEVAQVMGFGSVKKVDRLRANGILSGFMLDGTRLFSVEEIRAVVAQGEGRAA